MARKVSEPSTKRKSYEINWTEDQEERVRSMYYNELLGSRAIAKRLGISPGAAAGKLRRMGLRRKPPKVEPEPDELELETKLMMGAKPEPEPKAAQEKTGPIAHTPRRRGRGRGKKAKSDENPIRSITGMSMLPRPAHPYQSDHEARMSGLPPLLYNPRDPTCSHPGCGKARQHNRFGLCAEHDQQRIAVARFAKDREVAK